jgi:hypothetical protein
MTRAYRVADPISHLAGITHRENPRGVRTPIQVLWERALRERSEVSYRGLVGRDRVPIYT